jgi:hypothetical protein
MKLKKLILVEQSIADGKTGQEYKDAGYKEIAKGAINDKKKTGDVKTDVDGKSWYKATATTDTTGLSQYVGSYKEGIVTGDITDNDGTLTVSFKGMTGDLTNKGGDNFEFTVMKKTGTVKFTKNAQGKVNGFDYKWSLFHGHADKVDSSTSTSTSTASTSTSTTSTSTRKPADESKFACIKNSNTNGKNLQQTKDNPAAYSFFKGDGSEFIFWDNGDFAYWDGDAQAIGKWKCVGGNNFEANIDWGGTKHYYRSETNQWALTPNAKKINENIIKKIVSKNLKSLIK